MSNTQTIVVPDIGDFTEVDVVEVMVSIGDTVSAGDSLISLESDKASLDVPSPISGVVVKILVKVTDKVSQGTAICVMEASNESDTMAVESADKPADLPQSDTVAPPLEPEKDDPEQAPLETIAPNSPENLPHATPSVRRFARELGVDLSLVVPTGAKGRIKKTDVENVIRTAMAKERLGEIGETNIPVPPIVDFAKFGPVEQVALNRVRSLTAARMTASWLHAPQVTQFDQADITDLEAFRRQNTTSVEKDGFKFSLLPFLIKACTLALARFPNFNSSLSQDGKHLIMKKYFHIGIAVDTPNGLMVPVLRDANDKTLIEIARELAELSGRARQGKSRLDDFQGACFTISSLGGVGGTAFTPIVNVPEVAILGVSKAETKPIFDGEKFVPRLVLPLSLTYDHRVIDGAAAARFTRFLSEKLEDVRKMLL